MESHRGYPGEKRKKKLHKCKKEKACRLSRRGWSGAAVRSWSAGKLRAVRPTKGRSMKMPGGPFDDFGRNYAGRHFRSLLLYLVQVNDQCLESNP